MNALLYANNDPPKDNGPHKEFERHVVSDTVYGEMGVKANASANRQVWYGYRANPLLPTNERGGSNLSITLKDKVYKLKINEIIGRDYRRRVTLPDDLQSQSADPGIVYHYLEYKSYYNMTIPQRARILLKKADEAAAAAGAMVPAGAEDKDAVAGDMDTSAAAIEHSAAAIEHSAAAAAGAMVPAGAEDKDAVPGDMDTSAAAIEHSAAADNKVSSLVDDKVSSLADIQDPSVPELSPADGNDTSSSVSSPGESFQDVVDFMDSLLKKA